MSLFGALGASITGLGVQGQALSVISDNLANVNTIGYKRNRATFSQLVTSSGLAGTTFNAGGVGVNILRGQSVQGSLNSSDRTTDLALSGNGFFVVVGDSNITSDTPVYYTRDGAFGEDNRGYLKHSSGNLLLGWRTDSDGTIQNIQQPEAIELQTVGSSARPTSIVNVGANLNAQDDIYNLDLSLTPATVTPPAGTDQGIVIANMQQIVADPTKANFVTPARFYDGQGSARDVSIAYAKTGENSWDYVMYADGGDIVNGTAGTNTMIGYGSAEFNGDGSLKYVTVRDTTGNVVANDTLDIPWSGGVSAGSVKVNFGDYKGGLVFEKDDLDAAGVYLNENIAQISVDSTKAAAAGTDPTLPYQLFSDGAGGLYMVNDPAGLNGGPFTSNTVAVPSPLLTTTTLEFDNGVSVTVDKGFLAGAAGQIGSNFSATDENPKGTGVGTDGIIQFSSPYNVLFTNQDGFGSGTLSAVTVDENGFVIGAFTNGETKKLFKLVIAVFQEPSGLETQSGNLLRETDLSGRPLYKEAGAGNTATVSSGSLEQSTVDIATEFSSMIVSQRAFQASSKVISTVDQMLNDLLQLR